MAIGLFGGSFDPVHLGHLRIAEEVREGFSLERIYFIPAWLQPLKRLTTPADAGDRLQMIERAIRGNDHFRVSRVEIRRRDVSYTIDTVRYFARRFDDIYFLVGIDAFADIAMWKSYRDLFSYANFVVMVRPGSLAARLPETIREQTTAIDERTWEHASGKKIFLHRITQLDISSTRIRQLLQAGRSIKYLVPGAVEEYIKRRGLYRN
jgi:nicotinate-nucleotide adenylyltransferase